MDPYAVYVSVALPATFFISAATFKLAGVGVVSFAVLSALSGVTGGIDDLGVSFGSGGSLWRVVVVVNDREAVNLEAGFCALRRRSGLLFRGNIAIT